MDEARPLTVSESLYGWWRHKILRRGPQGSGLRCFQSGSLLITKQGLKKLLGLWGSTSVGVPVLSTVRGEASSHRHAGTGSSPLAHRLVACNRNVQMWGTKIACLKESVYWERVLDMHWRNHCLDRKSMSSYLALIFPWILLLLSIYLTMSNFRLIKGFTHEVYNWDTTSCGYGFLWDHFSATGKS